MVGFKMLVVVVRKFLRLWVFYKVSLVIIWRKLIKNRIFIGEMCLKGFVFLFEGNCSKGFGVEE